MVPSSEYGYSSHFPLTINTLLINTTTQRKSKMTGIFWNASLKGPNIVGLIRAPCKGDHSTPKDPLIGPPLGPRCATIDTNQGSHEQEAPINLWFKRSPTLGGLTYARPPQTASLILKIGFEGLPTSIIIRRRMRRS